MPDGYATTTPSNVSTVAVTAGGITSVNFGVEAFTPTPTDTATNTPTDTPTFTPTSSDTPTDTPTNTSTDTPTLTPTFTPTFTPTPTPSGPLTINYVYDPLNRLMDADYSNGDYYHYGYDAVGNRLTQSTSVNGQPSTTNYAYDSANRLTNVGSMNYTWDNNGNLLSDGVNTYTYNSANQLTGFDGQGLHASFAYDGLGDRLQQTIGGVPTNYAVDINNSLPQVLQDGTNSYVEGVGNLSQINGSTTDYFLTDALGSTRQLVNANDQLALTENYDPFGNTIASMGSDSSIFGFTGQQTTKPVCSSCAQDTTQAIPDDS
jgi:RHS Repeat